MPKVSSRVCFAMGLVTTVSDLIRDSERGISIGRAELAIELDSSLTSLWPH